MKITDADGTHLAYDARGEGEPVVLLHAFPLTSEMWREQAEELTRFGYRVITPDLRGFGASRLSDSDKATRGTTTMERMAMDAAGMLDELNVAHAVVGGLSMGGYVALAFQRLFPERVCALVLADTRAQADTDEARRGRAKMAAEILDNNMSVLVEKMLPRLLSETTQTGNEELTARVREMIKSNEPRGAAAALRGMAEREDHTARLKEISCPTLVIVGAEDEVTPRADAELMHRSIAGSRLEIIEGAGHLSNMERPAEFNQILRDFLNQL